jgi:hypothetical protein
MTSHTKKINLNYKVDGGCVTAGRHSVEAKVEHLRRYDGVP